MHDEHSEMTLIGQRARTERVFRTSEILRAELASFVHPKALAEIMDLAMQATESVPVEDVLREMRACIAGMLLNRVGEFMVKTQPAIEQPDRATRPPGKRAAA